MGDYENDQAREGELEQYGVWVKAGPEDVVETDEEFGFADLDAPPGDELEVSFDLDADDSDSDEIPTIDDLDITEPEEEPDPFGSLSIDDEDYGQVMPGADEELALPAIVEDEEVQTAFDAEDLPELELEEHDFTPDKQGIEIVAEPVNRLTPEEEQFLDEEVPAETPDLQNGGDRAIPSMMDQQEQAAFERIQTELADIKAELAELRRQLADRLIADSRAVAPPRAADESPEEDALGEELAGEQAFEDEAFEDVAFDEEVLEEGAVEEQVPVEETPAEESFEATAEISQRGPGFFEEDEDETIALTGDELDNILNTAEFVEQTGEAEQVDDDFAVPAAPSAGAPDDEFGNGVLIEGDEHHVDELAEMDIDKELAGIDELVDETEEAPEETLVVSDEDDLDAGFEDFADSVEDQLKTEEPVTEDEAAFVLDDEGDELQIEEEEPAEEAEQEPEEIVLDDIDDELVIDDDLGSSFDEAVDDDTELELDDIQLDDIELEDELGESAEEALEEEPELITDEQTEAEEFAESADEHPRASLADLPEELKAEIRSVLSYMDHLLEALPDEKIQEFAQSEHFEVYKRLFEELGLGN